jgi:phosphoglucosamine mutase
VARRYFGTDGVRGVVGSDLTVDVVRRLGTATALWSGGGQVFVGRDTRASGPELEQAFAGGVVAGGGNAALGGILPSPAVALFSLDVGAVISASHNPPEYNGVKFFDSGGSKLSDAAEEAIEALLDAPPAPLHGTITHVEAAIDRYLEHVLARFASDLAGLRVGVDCGNGAYAGLAPRAFEQLGAEVVAIGNAPDGTNINEGCGATDLRALERAVTSARLDLGVAFDGDGDRMLAVDERGDALDGDQIVAILALDLDVDLVAVTSMTNLGFHRLMAERGIRVVTTDVGDRYVLEALRREGGVLGGEQSGHIVYLRDHVTGDGLAAALLLCAALRGRRLSEAAAVMRRFPQAKENVRVRTNVFTDALQREIDDVNRELSGRGRVLVRASGTEPVVRVLAEAESDQEAERLCARIAALVQQELG